MDLVHEPGPLINNSLKDFFTKNPCQIYRYLDAKNMVE